MNHRCRGTYQIDPDKWLMYSISQDNNGDLLLNCKVTDVREWKTWEVETVMRKVEDNNKRKNL